MDPSPSSPLVRRVEDTWVEIEARWGDTAAAAEPIRLRPGTDDTEVNISLGAGALGKEVAIADLRRGLDIIEEQAA